MLQYFGGCTTGIQQANDTHAHEPLSKRFKKLEMIDIQRQRHMYPKKIPRRTRQKVYNDCDDAWSWLDHNTLGPKAHMQTGMTLDLDGLDDGEIYHDLKPLWYSKELGMDTTRHLEKTCSSKVA